MTRDHFKSIKGRPLYAAAVAFIEALRSEGLPLSVFETNDWSSNCAPSVYINLRGVKLADGRRDWRSRMLRQCRRLDAYGRAMALRWYLRNIDPSSPHLC